MFRCSEVSGLIGVESFSKGFGTLRALGLVG